MVELTIHWVEKVVIGKWKILNESCGRRTDTMKIEIYSEHKNLEQAGDKTEITLFRTVK